MPETVQILCLKCNGILSPFVTAHPFLWALPLINPSGTPGTISFSFMYLEWDRRETPNCFLQTQIHRPVLYFCSDRKLSGKSIYRYSSRQTARSYWWKGDSTDPMGLWNTCWILLIMAIYAYFYMALILQSWTIHMICMHPVAFELEISRNIVLVSQCDKKKPGLTCRYLQKLSNWWDLLI